MLSSVVIVLVLALIIAAALDYLSLGGERRDTVVGSKLRRAKKARAKSDKPATHYSQVSQASLD